ncbi:hypothetical protein ASF61_06830 [Duganella sp. Leaf126]|uniref:hypothetical protein n=1 Tax=Duganella sp. Leaf126 TaxID=1736266 RepID=UPI0006F29B4D|nr:hypothetical protein [Duganella sp. Leaf126]KQQ40461.1 hypothetical protein ASF61_06830 [Duganella sp. Leaf126]
MRKYGTFFRPFAADSLWNSRPINPVLDTWVIPPCFKPRGSTAKCYPSVAAGAWSSGVYQALPTDPAQTVYPQSGQAGVFDSDADEWKSAITIPHWPAGAVGATGSDGHCDIIDEEAGVIHSFWQLKSDSTGRFTARQYGWAPLQGTGFGDAAHYSQGARATGVPASAGMIRTHEVNDGKAMFEHALACSLDQTGLSASPAFIPPATSSDYNPQVNTGQIPEGALIMLPASYDTARLARWPLLQKVAETLKVFGARVVDRNEFTPFVIYVENGSGWKMSPLAWDTDMANELELIRAHLRQVMSQDGFIAGEEDGVAEDSILSLRGPWKHEKTGAVARGLYDTLAQGLRFDANTTLVSVKNSDGTGLRVQRYKPQAGDYLQLATASDCGARLKMVVHGQKAGGGVAPDLVIVPLDGAPVAFTWPPGGWMELVAWKFPGAGGVLRATLKKITEAEYLAATK